MGGKPDSHPGQGKRNIGVSIIKVPQWNLWKGFLWQTAMSDMTDQSRNFPRTVEEAVDRLISELSLRDRTEIAKMLVEDLGGLHVSLGMYIRNEFGLWTGNGELLESCRVVSRDAGPHQDDASSVIVNELWKTLRETHSLRAVE